VDEEEERIARRQIYECEKNETVNEFKTRLEKITRWLKQEVNDE
jgi:hypothetical protein